jgi:hypothetical protein
LGITDSLKEDGGLLLLLLAFGLLRFWLFDVGGFWNGKGLLKGIGLLKENC